MILFTGGGGRVRGGGRAECVAGGLRGLGPCVAGGCAWYGGMNGRWHGGRREACMAKGNAWEGGGMHGRMPV